jgi:hypothetical protein
LRPTIPQLARLARVQIPFMEEARALSSCFNEVVIPWSSLTVPSNDGEPASDIGRVFEETGYGLAGIAGESRSGDANGQYIRVAAGGGFNTIVTPAPPGSGLSGNLVGSTTFPIQGAEPSIASSARPPFRPTVPCENQEVPDLRSGGVEPFPAGQQSRQSSSNVLTSSVAGGEVGQLSRKYAAIYMDYMAAQQARAAGNALRGDKMMDDVAQRFREYEREDMPRYLKAVRALTGGGG